MRNLFERVRFENLKVGDKIIKGCYNEFETLEVLKIYKNGRILLSGNLNEIKFSQSKGEYYFNIYKCFNDGEDWNLSATKNTRLKEYEGYFVNTVDLREHIEKRLLIEKLKSIDTDILTSLELDDIKNILFSLDKSTYFNVYSNMSKVYLNTETLVLEEVLYKPNHPTTEICDFSYKDATDICNRLIEQGKKPIIKRSFHIK